MRNRFTASVLTAVMLAFGLASSAHADTTYGLGGGTEWQPGSVFPLIAGGGSPVSTKMFVQNLGQNTAKVDLNVNAPAGLKVTAEVPMPLSIPPGEMVDLPLRIENAPVVAPGVYKVLVSVEQINVPAPSAGGTVYAPAVNGSFSVAVGGQAQNLTVNTVNAADGTPARGNLSLYYLSRNEQPLLLETKEGSTLKRKAVAGSYRMLFEIPGLIQRTLDFKVYKGRDRNLIMKVQGVQFTLVSAKANMSGREVKSAKLVAVLQNGLNLIEGPLTVYVDVMRDGDLVESFELAKLSELNQGMSEYSSLRYSPPNGFEGGVWEFQFGIKNDQFKVEADTLPGFSISGSGYIWWLLALALTLIGISVAGLVGLTPAGIFNWFFLIGKRRKRKEEEDEDAARLAEIEAMVAQLRRDAEAVAAPKPSRHSRKKD